MELEEMKTLWGEMSAEIEKQKKLTDSLIIKMTQVNYKNKMNKILIPEVTGSIVCFAGLIFILLNMQKLNNWYLLACGIITVIILLILPVLSIKAIRRMMGVNILNNDLKQSLLEYAKSKKQFVSVQKLSFYLGAILMLTTIPVAARIIGEMDLFIKTRLWLWYAIAFPFFYGITNWIFKSYNKTSKAAENILKELDV
jgi:hypothetical protein